MIVVIPTMHIEHLNSLLDDLHLIDLFFVEKIFIFNNSNNNLSVSDSKVYVFNLGENIGVNPVWNYGLKIAEALDQDIMLLNDDVYFKKDFFSKTEEALRQNECFSVVCPYTAKSKEDFDIGFNPEYQNRYHMMMKRNGWCFTINKKYISNIPLIPSDMKIFCGDDWIWHHTKQLWVKDYENIIYHQVGRTMKRNRKLRALLREDKKTFAENIKQQREK